MKKFHWAFALTMLASMRTVACNTGSVEEDPDQPGGPSTPEEGPCAELAEAAGWIQGDRISSTAESTPARISAVGEQTWNVALKMLKAVPSTQHPSMAQSSTSLYTALSMAYPRYESHECGPQIVEVLEFPETGMDIHHSVGAGLREIAKRAIPKSEDSDGLTLNFTNSIWAIQSTELPEPSELQSIYGATPNAVDTYGEPARALMNCLIEEDSQGLLVDFLPEGYPDKDTFTADVNVSYLAAPWEEKMTESPVEFTKAGGSPEMVDGMRAYGVHRMMYDAETFTTIEVPLLGGELAMLFVVPKDTFSGTLDEFAADLTVSALSQARSGAESHYINFAMPKVDIPSTTIDYLTPLEMVCNPIGGIRQIFHGAAVEMDADGIKAAAATVVFGDGDSAPEPPEEDFEIDRPFLFFVHDAATGFALFHGRYAGAAP